MRRWLERARGTLGIAATWGVGWAIVSVLAAMTGLFGTFDLNDYGFLAAIAATVGSLGGLGFSTVLMLTEGRRRFDEMSLPRMAAWGALGGGLMAVGFILLGEIGIVTAGFFALMGSASATASLAVARRAEPVALPASPSQLAVVDRAESD